VPQQAPATSAPPLGAQQKVVLYEEDPADPNGKRRPRKFTSAP
jgi:hypothetical protein